MDNLPGRQVDTASPDGQVAQGALPVAITPRTLWIAVGIVASTLLGVFLIAKALGALLLLFVAILLAEGIRPIVNGLRRLHLPRPVAILLIYLVALGLVVGLGWVLAQPLVAQALAFSNSLPDYAAQLQRFATSAQQAVDANPTLAAALSQLAARTAAEASAAVPTLVSIPLSVIGLLFSVVVMLTMAFFWLTALDALRPFLLGLLPEKTQATAQALLDDLGSTLGGYLRGVVANMLIIGTLTGLGLFVFDVPYALLLGILAGLTEIIPFLGPWISGSVAVLVALAVGGPIKALEVFILFEVIQLLEGNTVVPLVMSRTVRINPLAVIVAVLIGGSLLGVPGAVLGVPIAGAIQVVIQAVLAPLARRAVSAPPDQTSAPPLVAVVAPTAPAFQEPR